MANAMAQEVRPGGDPLTSERALSEVFDSFALFDLLIELEDEFKVAIDIAAIPETTPLNAVTFAELIDTQR